MNDGGVGDCGRGLGVAKSSELGSFLTGIPAPLGLGKVQLADGRWESGFICEAHGLEDAVDISHLGGWRAYLQSPEGITPVGVSKLTPTKVLLG